MCLHIITTDDVYGSISQTLFLLFFSFETRDNWYSPKANWSKMCKRITRIQYNWAILLTKPCLSTVSSSGKSCYDYEKQNVHHFHTDYWRSMGTAVAQSLRCCAANRKVAGSIPNSVTGIFHWHNPSDHTMDLGSTQPLTEMNTRRISWG